MLAIRPLTKIAGRNNHKIIVDTIFPPASAKAEAGAVLDGMGGCLTRTTGCGIMKKVVVSANANLKERRKKENIRWIF